MGYPLHLVNGFSLEDKLGRWEEREDSMFLRSFPGLRSTNIEVPGAPGVSVPSMMPHESAKAAVSMRVHAIDSRGRLATTRGERALFIQENLDIIIRSMQLGLTARTGKPVTLERRLGPRHVRYGFGRFEAASELKHSMDMSYADLDFFFHIPTGVWRGPIWGSRKIRPGEKDTLAGLAGTTTVYNAKVACFGPFTSMTLIGADGNGFTLNRSCSAGRYILVDTERWQNSSPLQLDAKGEPSFVQGTSFHDLTKIYGLTPTHSALPLSPHELAPGASALTVSAAGGDSNTAVQVWGRASYF